MVCSSRMVSEVVHPLWTALKRGEFITGARRGGLVAILANLGQRRKGAAVALAESPAGRPKESAISQGALIVALALTPRSS